MSAPGHAMSQGLSWLRFRVGGQIHALEAAPVRQVVLAPRLIALPSPERQPHCAGLMAWQGRPLLVLDLGTCLLRRSSLAGGDARFLVWTQAQQAGVLAVDGVEGLLRLSPATLTRHWAPARPGLPAPWNAIQGLLHAGEGAGDRPSASLPAAADPIAVFDVAALWQACWAEAEKPR